MKKRVVIIILLIAAVILALVYFNFFYTKKCSNQECFNSALYNCDKASYLSDGESAVWQYTISGVSKTRCNVNTKIIQLKQGNIELLSLEGKSMDCSLPLLYIGSPSKDLSLCHGILKEEIQNLFIKRLNNLAQNIDAINQELV